MVEIKNNIYVIFIILVSCTTLQFDNSTESVFNSAKKSLSEGNYNRAKGEFEFVILNDPLSPYAEDSFFYLGETKYYLEQYSDAILEYKSYLKLPVRNATLSKKSEFMICKSWFYLSNDVMKDQTDTKIAIDKLQYYIEKESMEEYTDQINKMIISLRNKLAKKDFQTAMLYLKLEKEESAKIYFQNIINEYYDSEYVQDCIVNIAYLKAENNKNTAIEYLKSNRNSFVSNDKFQDAVDNINNK